MEWKFCNRLAQHHRPQERLIALPALETRHLRMQPGLAHAESRGLHALPRARRILKVRTVFHSNQMLLEWRLPGHLVRPTVRSGKVAHTSELRHQPPSRLQRTMQAPEHRRVVRNPVKDRVAENPIHLVRQFKILQAGVDKLNTFAKSR